ncbi:MAG TPA: hypothetical protein VED86_05705 [archaeon]|nr:hypothetical protein [archaeon]
MVSESIKKNQPIYHCELCEFGYKDIGTAEACEQFCDSHGFSSPEIVRKATYRPLIPILSLAA